MIALVVGKSILFPSPNLPPVQPVLINQTLVPCYLTFLANSSAYTVGCKGKKAYPKQAEKVGLGSETPISVPATLAVYPDMK